MRHLKSNRPKNEGVVDHEINGDASVDAAQENAHTLVNVEMSSNMRLLFMSFLSENTRRDLTATHHPRMIEQEVKTGQGEEKVENQRNEVRSATTSRIVDITET